MTKKEMDLLLGVLKKYVDTRICEILDKPDREKDPGDVASMLWHKFEVSYMRDFSGNSTPITHVVFREFLHWLDDAMEDFEKILKAYCDTKIDEKFESIKLATSLNIFQDETDGKWYIELLDQDNTRMGTAKEIPFYKVTTDEESGLTVTENATNKTFDVAIKTKGVDEESKRYVKTDKFGAYAKVDQVKPILATGTKIATVEKGVDGTSVDLLAPHTLVPSADNLIEGTQRKVLGTYGNNTVYYDDKACIFEGHYQPSNEPSENKQSLLDFADEKRRVITGITIDKKGHFISGTYAEVNADGTLGEDQDITVTPPSQPEEDDNPVYNCAVTIKVLDADSTTSVLVQEMGNYQGTEGQYISLVTQRNTIIQAMASRYANYEFVDNPTEYLPSGFSIDSTKSALEFTIKAKKKDNVANKTKFNVTYKYQDSVLDTAVIYTDLEVGERISPSDESEIDDVVTAWVAEHGYSNTYVYGDGSDITVAAENNLVVNVTPMATVTPDFTLVFKRDGIEIGNTEVSGVTGVAVGSTLNPSANTTIDNAVKTWTAAHGCSSTAYSYASNAVRVQRHNEIIVNVTASGTEYEKNTSIQVNTSADGEDTYTRNTMPSASNSEWFALPTYDDDPDTSKIATLPIFITVDHDCEVIGNDDQGTQERWTAIVGLHVDWTAFSAWQGNIGVSITMRDNTTRQIDLGSADFTANQNGRTDTYVKIEQSGVTPPYVKNIDVRYNFTFKLKP